MNTSTRSQFDLPIFARLCLSRVAIAVTFAASTAAGQAAPARATSSAPTIPIAEWDDDWWYPEGSIKFMGLRFSPIVGASLTRFTHATTRSRFGTSGVEPDIDIYRPSRKGTSLDVDIAWTGFPRSGENARFLAPMIGVRRVFADATRSTWLVPFAAARVGPYFTNVSGSGRGVTPGANALLGLDIARRVFLSARYDLLRSVNGNNLSRFSIKLMTSVPLRRSATTRAKMHDDIPAPGRLIDVDGHRMHLLCVGTGSPTVVFDAGMSDAWTSWLKVQPAVATHTRACSYDRAGIGYSDPGPLPRTSERIAGELHALLQAGGVEGPYVLVGHSFGGFNIRLFASRYPSDVVGLVFVDASHPDQLERYPVDIRGVMDRMVEAAAGLSDRAARGDDTPPLATNLPLAIATRPAWYKALSDEGRSFAESAREVRMSTTTFDVPLVVLTHGKEQLLGVPRASADAMERATCEMQAELVRLSPRGTQVIATESGHYVQHDQPQLVIDAITRVVDEARASRRVP